jgi:hypothetical protein
VLMLFDEKTETSECEKENQSQPVHPPTTTLEEEKCTRQHSDRERCRKKGCKGQWYFSIGTQTLVVTHRTPCL